MYAELRSAIDVHFHKIYEHAVRMATSVNVIPSMPRVTGKQCHRVNAPSDSVESHYIRNTVIPFLDYVISDLNLQFSEASITCASLVGLVSSFCHYPKNDRLFCCYRDIQRGFAHT